MSKIRGQRSRKVSAYLSTAATDSSSVIGAASTPSPSTPITPAKQKMDKSILEAKTTIKNWAEFLPSDFVQKLIDSHVIYILTLDGVAG